jgi:carboxylesterase type B
MGEEHPAFGDPNNVTVPGTAGAIMVGALVGSPPGEKGLFSRAIAERRLDGAADGPRRRAPARSRTGPSMDALGVGTIRTCAPPLNELTGRRRAAWSSMATSFQDESLTFMDAAERHRRLAGSKRTGRTSASADQVPWLAAAVRG